MQQPTNQLINYVRITNRIMKIKSQIRLNIEWYCFYSTFSLLMRNHFLKIIISNKRKTNLNIILISSVNTTMKLRVVWMKMDQTEKGMTFKEQFCNNLPVISSAMMTINIISTCIKGECIIMIVNQYRNWSSTTQHPESNTGK